MVIRHAQGELHVVVVVLSSWVHVMRPESRWTCGRLPHEHEQRYRQRVLELHVTLYPYVALTSPRGRRARDDGHLLDRDVDAELDLVLASLTSM